MSERRVWTAWPVRVLAYAVAVAAVALLFGSLYWFSRAGSAARWEGQVTYIAEPGPSPDQYTLHSVPGSVPATVPAGSPATTIAVTLPANQLPPALPAGAKLTCHTKVTDVLNTATGGNHPTYTTDHCHPT